MNSLRRLSTIIAAVLIAVSASADAIGDQYVAYSLKRAEELIRDGGVSLSGLQTLGGITDPLAIVHDADGNDFIIIGRVQSSSESVGLDDFVVALRAMFKHETWPMVSIDPTKTLETTGKQEVRFLGGIAGTSFGMTLFEADVLLKKVALGELPAETWGVRSYFDRRCDQAKRAEVRGRVRTRFWFIRDKGASTVAHSSGACGIEGFKLRVQTHVANNLTDKAGSTVSDDRAGEGFAEALTACYDDLATEFPVLIRVKRLFQVLGLASGLRVMQEKYQLFQPQELAFWLDEYSVSAVQTPESYDLIEKERVVDQNGKVVKVELDGGIELQAHVLELRDGTIDALRDIVVKLRPNPSALTWEIPLDKCGIHWTADGMECADLGNTMLADIKSGLGATGCTLDARIFEHAPADMSGTLPSSGSDDASLANFPAPPMGMPTFNENSRLSPFHSTSGIGGVMLSGAATVDGVDTAQVSLADGNFSLVVDGKNARIDPLTYRKFITALWCVYYCDQDPGISIDPIAPDVDKHLVRYIGRVINTDLGRVMREADYIMKKWAVGTEKPDVDGFQDVDDLTVVYGHKYFGASRRFWFVPEDLSFKRGGNLLMFDAGRMRLKTEYIVMDKPTDAEPADLAFAKYFTEHYDEIAEKHPAYRELFEYAKMVSLAKYIKEQGVPLHWFLMAHKDLVLTEDSPGTVDELAKGSKHYEGVTITGGVNLGINSSYVYDDEAVKAIRDAMAKQPRARTRLAVASPDVSVNAARPFGLKFREQSYSVLPQHTLTSGKDHRGIRYQTDLALRRDGRPGLEVVRYFNPKDREGGQFGAGWHLLIPYRVEPADGDTREFLNVTIPQRMAVRNLLSGEREVLTFSEDRYSAAGYVPETLAESQVVGLFIMSNRSFRLADKLGNQFHFDRGGRLTDQFLSSNQAHHMHFEYADEFTSAFARVPYRVAAAGDEQVQVFNVTLPKRLKVTDLLHNQSEELTYNDENGTAAFLPEDAETSRFQELALLQNGGLVLTDTHGNKVRFDSQWRFHSVRPAVNCDMVRTISMGNRKTTFNYTIAHDGRVVIASAALSEDTRYARSTWVARYEYGQDGRLCRVRRPERILATRQHSYSQHLALCE